MIDNSRHMKTGVSLVNINMKKTIRQRTALREVTNNADIKNYTNLDKCDAKKKLDLNNRSDLNNKRISLSILKIKDIDKENEANLFLVTDYVNDIYRYLRFLENKYLIPKNYLAERQVTWVTRSIVVDWLVDVHVQFHLLQETLHLSVSILDTFLLKTPSTSKNEVQLIAITATYLASKYEECIFPDLRDLIHVCDSAFTKKQILQMENKILKTLDFCLARSNAVHFVRRYNMAANSTRLEYTYSKYFIDLSLVSYGLCHVKPSIIAAAALYITKCISNGQVNMAHWNCTVAFYSTYNFVDFAQVVPKMAQVIKNASNSNLTAVRRKYSSDQLLNVSLKNTLNTSNGILNSLIHPNTSKR